jgi:lipoprotein
MKAINHKKHNQKVLCMVSVLFILIFTLSGCAKCISTETTTVQVKITDEYHRSMYVIPVYNGKTTTLVTHPAEYRITVEYDGIEYVISGRDVYDKYSDKVGEYTNGTLETKTYDNGIIDYDIIELE